MIPAINLEKLESIFAQLERRGVQYGLGAKAPKLTCPPSAIKKIDCSGAVRYLLFQATDGALVLPDGSQNQRAWCEAKAREGDLRKVNYEDAANYITDTRLFIAFIKPFVNGCGEVGHVWLLTNYDNAPGADTLESYGGVGIGSRPWNSRTLRREVFSCYELPVAK